MAILFAIYRRSVIIVFMAFTILNGSSNPQLGQDGEIDKQLEQIKAKQELARETYRQALTESQDTAIENYYREVNNNCDEALRLARFAKSEPVSLDARQFVIRTARGGPSDHSAQAYALLGENHFAAPLIGEFCVQMHWLSDFKESEELMRLVRRKHPMERERAYATYALGLLLKGRINQCLERDAKAVIDIQDGRELPKGLQGFDVAAATTEANDLFREVCSEYGDVEFDGKTMGEVTKGTLFGVEHLRIGSTIPEISGLDHDDQKHSLNDLRGRVVVLTFSGDWCGPCKAMYPQLRELREKYESKGLSVVSVVTDKTIDTLRQAIAEKDITWRCWWDGEDGKIVSRWGITAFPSIFVVDRKGIIRFKNVRDKPLEKAVQFLLDKTVDEQSHAPELRSVRGLK